MYLIKRVKDLGGSAYKWSAPNTRGVFDRICVLPGGAVWFIELKSKTGKLSPLQSKFLRRMLGLGFMNCRVLWSKNEIDNWLRGQGYD